jgi:hypothetical protein
MRNILIGLLIVGSSLLHAGPGFTVIHHKGFQLSYSQETGRIQPGCLQGIGNKFPDSAWLAQGWTHSAATRTGVLFYNADTGSVAVGEWAAASDPRLMERRSHEEGSFPVGWTHVVDTGSGILFYNSADGEQFIVDVTAAGRVSIRENSFGWMGDSLLFAIYVK